MQFNVLYVKQKGGKVAKQNELSNMNSTLELLEIVRQELWEKVVKKNCRN